MATLREKCSEAFKECLSLREAGDARFRKQKDPVEIRRQLDAFTTTIVDYAIREKEQGLTVDQIKTNIQNGSHRIADLHYPRQIGTSYQYMYETCKALNELREQEMHIDLKERRRYLRYRIYTAIGIAAIIFLTACLSHWTGIPLPFSRAIPV